MPCLEREKDKEEERKIEGDEQNYKRLMNPTSRLTGDGPEKHERKVRGEEGESSVVEQQNKRH